MQKGSLSQTILSLLHENHFLTPLEMQQLLGESGENYNKTSIYRAIDSLIEQDLICKQDFLDKEACYELKANHHDHLLCTGCGVILSVECMVPEQEMINDFLVDHHHLTVFGQCADCQKNK